MHIAHCNANGHVQYLWRHHTQLGARSAQRGSDAKTRFPRSMPAPSPRGAGGPSGRSLHLLSPAGTRGYVVPACLVPSTLPPLGATWHIPEGTSSPSGVPTRGDVPCTEWEALHPPRGEGPSPRGCRSVSPREGRRDPTRGRCRHTLGDVPTTGTRRARRLHL